MKKLLLVASSLFIIWLVCYIVVNTELPFGTEGPEGSNTIVSFHIPSSSGGVTLKFPVSGDVQLVRFTPRNNYPDHDGFVDLKVKTSKGWYESPRASVGGSINWEKELRVKFEYPQEQILRERTASFVRTTHRILGILTETAAGWGCPPIEGDIAKINLVYNDGDSIDFLVERTTGLQHSGHGSGIKKEKVEILISPEVIAPYSY